MSDDFDFEPIPGLPESLPRGEWLLWQGAPDWRSLARRALHVPLVVLYCGLLLGWVGYAAYTNGASVGAAFGAAIEVAPLALVAIGLLTLMAWLQARTTVYSITNRRVVMRCGVALPVTFNLPFSAIETAALRSYRDGTGDIPLALRGDNRIAYFQLWPHARPWRLKQPQPMLRCVRDAPRIADLLGGALAAAAAAAEPSRSTVIDVTSHAAQTNSGPMASAAG